MRAAFVDFWEDFDPETWWVTRALREKWDVRVVNAAESPDIVFSSDFGVSRVYCYAQYACPVVHFSGENVSPDLLTADCALTMTEDTSRNLFLPLATEILDKIPSGSVTAGFDRPFCSCVISNMKYADPERAGVVDVINSYKPVDFGGRWRNNVGGPVPDKHVFISGYKFNIAAENSAAPYYITEKLTEAFAARTVPIYWGAPNVGEFFNKEAFVDFRDYDTEVSLMAELRRIDENPDVYYAYLNANPVRSYCIEHWKDRLWAFIERVLRTGKTTNPYGRQMILRNFWRNSLVQKMTK